METWSEYLCHSAIQEIHMLCAKIANDNHTKLPKQPCPPLYESCHALGQIFKTVCIQCRLPDMPITMDKLMQGGNFDKIVF